MKKELSINEMYMKTLEGPINWWSICINYKLNNDFLLEFKDEINWAYVSFHQSLNLNSLNNEIINKLDWDEICTYKNISLSNLIKFRHKIKISLLLKENIYYRSVIRRIICKLLILLGYK